MPNPVFHVTAVWDEEASVFISESDIKGLVIETSTIEEFEEVLEDLALELILSNHMTASDLATRPMSEIIPTIIWTRPTLPAEAA